MKSLVRVLKPVSVAALFGLAVSCSPIDTNYGYIPAVDSLEKLEVGVSGRGDVLEHAGQPATRNDRYGESWYYLSSRFRQDRYRPIEEIDRQLVAITFDEEGIVSNVEHYTMQDGRPVALSRRVTESNIGRLNVIEQMLRGLGRIDPTRVLGNN